MELQEVIDQFQIEGGINQITSHGNGHIHETFHVINKDKGAPDYLLQKINHEVFKDVTGMMNNIQLVTNFLKKKSPERINLTLVPTKKGAAYFEYGGSFWRVFVFLEGLISYDTLTDENLVYEGGRMLGDFLNRLSGLEPDKLVETIPDFHDLSSRFQQFKSAVDVADELIKSRVEQEIAFVQKLMRSSDFEFVPHMPIRVTHNDTKLNNVLFDAHGKAQCVIDLDTVMPGLVHYDVGDAIRTACATAPEDEADLQLVGLDLDRVHAFSVGYLEATRDSLTKEEIETLHLAIPLMSLIMGVRFLTDFLQGDRYYKINHPDQNMHRAKAQLRQTAISMDQLIDLKRMINRA
ncbi:MAG: aminoglycoside phosphotransferase family protein [Cytophagales bacterium]|nr:aminoglycoside phosphotransferase family protein [Cytophagales bacterium]